jgi:hypothetical protein
MNKQKTGVDIERLLQWAYIDELSKRQSSAAEGIWDHIQDYANHGGIDKGQGAAQRYAHFGLPDPDAERIESAVSALGETLIDWDQHFETIAGELTGLIAINDLSPRAIEQRRPPKADWGGAGDRALQAFFGKGGNIPSHDRPRDVIMVGGIKTAVLVTMHAIKGTRPDCHVEDSRPEMVPAARGTGAAIVGECRGKNLYTTGAHCPLTWSPSPLSVVTSRADYFAWHQGLVQLSETLSLEKFVALPPKASPAPWLGAGESEEVSRIIPVMPTGRNNVGAWGVLPLTPQRPKAGPPARQRRDPGKILGRSA